MINNFKELEIWKLGIQIVKETYQLTGLFPQNETYGLSAQIRRAAVSVPSNIAEGFKRKHPKEFKQFLNIAFGSLAEVETQLIIAKELGYIDEQKVVRLSEKIELLNKMMYKLFTKIS
jgi:four helix bundle protein